MAVYYLSTVGAAYKVTLQDNLDMGTWGQFFGTNGYSVGGLLTVYRVTI